MGRKFDSLLSSIRYRIPVAQPTLNTSQLLGQVQKGALLSFESGERGGAIDRAEVGFEFEFALNRVVNLV